MIGQPPGPALQVSRSREPLFATMRPLQLGQVGIRRVGVTVHARVVNILVTCCKGPRCVAFCGKILGARGLFLTHNMCTSVRRVKYNCKNATSVGVAPCCCLLHVACPLHVALRFPEDGRSRCRCEPVDLADPLQRSDDPRQHSDSLSLPYVHEQTASPANKHGMWFKRAVKLEINFRFHLLQGAPLCCVLREK